MKKIISIVSVLGLLTVSCNSTKQEDSSSSKKEISVSATSQEAVKQEETGKVIHLTTAQFKELVYDYTTNPTEWVYKGTQPCIIDFYADWCRPCKMIAPYLDEIAKDNAGKLIVYKVNTDNEKELSQVFQVQGIPLVVAVPLKGTPEAHTGAYPKEQYQEIAKKLIEGAK